MGEYGLEENVYKEECGFSIEEGRKGAERLLKTHCDIDGIFCSAIICSGFNVKRPI